MGFRKLLDENAWHWRSECPGWPRTNYGEVDALHSIFNPATDVFCPACRSIENALRPDGASEASFA